MGMHNFNFSPGEKEGEKNIKYYEVYWTSYSHDFEIKYNL